MPDVRLAVRRRGSVVKGEFLLALVLGAALFGDLVFLPEIEDLFLLADEIERSVYFFIHLPLLLLINKKQTRSLKRRICNPRYHSFLLAHSLALNAGNARGYCDFPRAG